MFEIQTMLNANFITHLAAAAATAASHQYQVPPAAASHISIRCLAVAVMRLETLTALTTQYTESHDTRVSLFTLSLSGAMLRAVALHKSFTSSP